jgi:hypothetical protein
LNGQLCHQWAVLGSGNSIGIVVSGAGNAVFYF